MSRENEQAKALPPERKVTCKVCKEKIFEGAITCSHCGSFQDWRRHLSISNASFALLMATFSSISVIISSIFSLATPRSHTIYTTFNIVGGGVEGNKERTLAFNIWNEGKEPGKIHEVFLKYNFGNNEPVTIGLFADKYSKLDFLRHEEHGEIFLRVLPHERYLLKDFNLISAQDHNLSCKVEIKSLGIKGDKKEVFYDDIESNDCIKFLESYS